jgi:hypothetical protein
MAETVELVRIDLESINKGIDDTTEKIVALESANSSLRKDLKKTNEELEKEGKARSQLNKELALNSNELKDLKKERNVNIKLLKTEINSLDQAKALRAQLVKERKKLNLSTEEGTQRLKEINDELAKNQEFINDSSDGFDNFTGTMQGVKDQLGGIAEGFGNMAGEMVGAQGAGSGLLNSLKAFLTNPYAAIFAAIAGAVMFIGKALGESRSSSLLMQQATSNLSSAMDVAKSSVRDWFENTKENAKEHGTFKTVLKEYAKALTGVSLVQGITSKKNQEQFKTIRDLRKELILLNDAYIDIENELQKEIVSQQGLSQIQMSIADDDTRSMQERRAAAEQGFKLEEKALQANVKLASERLSISEKEIEVGIAAKKLIREADGSIKSLTKEGIDLEKAYNEASIAAIQASNELTQKRIENQRRIRKINQDDFEQELDFLLDIADAQKSVNEQQIADQRIALQERKKLLEETKGLIENSFDAQISLFERELGVQLERNKIMNLNNQEIFEYARGLELSEIATNRLREVIIERRKAVHDLNMAERDLNEQETTRKSEALKKISEFNKQQLLLESGSLEAQRDLKIAFETEEFENKKANKMLLDEELQALEVEHVQALRDINDNYRSEQEKKDVESAKKRKEIFKTIQDFASKTFSDLFDFIDSSQEASLQIQLANAEGNEEKQEKIRRDFAKKKKRSAISQAIANSALAVIKAFSELGPLAGVIASAFILATTGAQISRIRAEEFAEGGEVNFGKFHGPSHSGGGINLYTGSGQRVANVEGDEGFFVVNKRDTPEAIAALSAINSKHGKAFAPRSYMQDGGEAALSGSSGITFEQALALAEARPIQVSVIDINNAMAKEASVVANGEI